MYVSTMRGLGVTTAQGTQAGAGAASGALEIFSAPTVGGKIAGGGMMVLSAAPFAGPAAPIVAIVGTVIVVAGRIISYVGWGDGCGKTCILTSGWANDAEALLRQNIEAYFASPVRNKATQDAALGGFDAIWGQLAAACGEQKDTNCTGDRQAGACKWKQTGNSPWPGGPSTGECWNWFAAYRDPIAHDVGVVPDSMIDMGSVSAAVDSVFGGASGMNLLPLLLIGGLVILAVKS